MICLSSRCHGVQEEEVLGSPARKACTVGAAE